MGRPPSENPRDVRLSVAITRETMSNLKDRAEQEGVGVTTLARRLIVEAVGGDEQ